MEFSNIIIEVIVSQGTIHTMRLYIFKVYKVCQKRNKPKITKNLSQIQTTNKFSPLTIIPLKSDALLPFSSAMPPPFTPERVLLIFSTVLLSWLFWWLPHPENRSSCWPPRTGRRGVGENHTGQMCREVAPASDIPQGGLVFITTGASRGQ